MLSMSSWTKQSPKSEFGGGGGGEIENTHSLDHNQVVSLWPDRYLTNDTKYNSNNKGGPCDLLWYIRMGQSPVAFLLFVLLVHATWSAQEEKTLRTGREEFQATSAATINRFPGISSTTKSKAGCSISTYAFLYARCG